MNTVTAQTRTNTLLQGFSDLKALANISPGIKTTIMPLLNEPIIDSQSVILGYTHAVPGANTQRNKVSKKFFLSVQLI
jgi:hypothetical protein